MEKFIYVFSKEARNKLLSQGLRLLYSDDGNETYVFENDSALSFSLSGISVIKSDTLNF